MMDAPFTAYRDTPNKSPRQNVARRGVILHHAAMTSLSGLRSLAMGGKQVSATAIVKDDAAERLVSDSFRPWSVSSAYWDSAMRSVETCNESTDGWTISDASHWTLARLVAYWAELDGWWPHRDGDPGTWTVIGHREVWTIHGASYATACPGGMDVNLVVARAQGILGGTMPAGSTTKPINTETEDEEDDMPDSMFAHVDGVPSWCWLNWATGKLVAVHTQQDADWVASYMGGVRSNWAGDKLGGDKYKSKLALFGMLGPAAEIVVADPVDYDRIQGMIDAGLEAVLAGSGSE